VKMSRSRSSFPLRREARGFYRSRDLRFSAISRKNGRRWSAFDKRKPGHVAKCKTLRECRRWFALALACDSGFQIETLPVPLPAFF
jgi:hypothetical protein